MGNVMNLSLLEEVQESMVMIIGTHMPIDVFGNSIWMPLKASPLTLEYAMLLLPQRVVKIRKYGWLLIKPRKIHWLLQAARGQQDVCKCFDMRR
jgi:hypothetical protein